MNYNELTEQQCITIGKILNEAWEHLPSEGQGQREIEIVLFHLQTRYKKTNTTSLDFDARLNRHKIEVMLRVGQLVDAVM